MSDHERHRENAGAYVLGALPELEAQAFELHLTACERCREEVEWLRPGADVLLRAVPQHAPPPALKESIMAAVREDVRGQSRTRAREERRPFALRIPALAQLRPTVAWAGAAFAILVGAVAGVGLSGVLGRDGGTRTLSAEVDRQRAPDASARLVIPEDGDVAVLDVRGLRTTPGEDVYVVWTQGDGEPVFESSFDVRRDGSGKAAIEGVGGVDRVMVTRERSADVAAPTDEPVLTVPLT